MDYTKLSPQEKMELYLKNKSLSPEEYGKFEQNLIAKGDTQPDDKSQLGFQDYAFKDVSFLNDKNNIVNEINSLNIDEKDKRYLRKLSKMESGYNPKIRNQFGYMGLYQFGKPALQAVGMTEDEYINNSQKQHQAALKLMDINTKGLEKYYGSTFNGIKLNKHNLAAAAQLGGRGTVNKLLSGKINDFKDGNGISIFKYLKLFENI